jgi:PAS domain S-box-containing protein
MFGYTASEIVGRSIQILIPEELKSEEDEIIRRVSSGDRIEHFETIRVAKDGHRINISLSVSPIRTSEGEIIGASKIVRDITEQKAADLERQRLLLEAEESRREAEAANSAKDQFLAVLSHELRTPLHSMRAWARMLKDGVLNDDEQSKALDVILRGIDSQNTLISDLLDVSRIVSNKLVIESLPVSMVSVVTDAVETLRPLAESRGVDLALELDPAANNIRGDSVRLQQIINNLINNAIRYTPQDGVVAVRLSRIGENAEVSVQDSGIGITEENLTRIFERFEQGDSTSGREHGGLGLGLTIARHLAQLHSGSIHAESKGLGHGARFVLTLPLTQAQATNSSDYQARPLDATKPLSGLSVLIVEDDIDSLEMLEVALQRFGASVTAVSRSAEVLKKLANDKFDVLISDLGLPVVDGFQMIKEIRGSMAITSSDLPAIALSGYVGHDDRNRSLESGFQRHLAKPLDIDALPNVILSVIGVSD